MGSIRIRSRVAVLAAAVILTAGCGRDAEMPAADPGRSPAGANRVLASIPAQPIESEVGATTDIVLSFMTDDGRPATGLTLVDPGALPVGWSVDPAAAGCAAIGDGADCRVRLRHSPTVIGPARLDVAYRYRDASGTDRNERVAFDAAAVLRLVYVTDFGADAVHRCRVLATGALADCAVAATGFASPVGLAIDGRRLYVANSDVNGAFEGWISSCSIADDGALTDCGARTPVMPVPLSLRVADGIAYVGSPNGEAGGSNVWRCPVGAGADPLGCTMLELPIQSLQGIALTANDLYGASLGQPGILRCTRIGAAAFTDCRPAGSGHGAPYGIVFHEATAWLSELDENRLRRCAVDAAGDLVACTAVDVGVSPPLNGPYGISIDGSSLFVTSSNDGRVVGCTLAPDGGLSGCADAAAGFTTPAEIGRTTLR